MGEGGEGRSYISHNCDRHSTHPCRPGREGSPPIGLDLIPARQAQASLAAVGGQKSASLWPLTVSLGDESKTWLQTQSGANRRSARGHKLCSSKADEAYSYILAMRTRAKSTNSPAESALSNLGTGLISMQRHAVLDHDTMATNEADPPASRLFYTLPVPC